MTTEHDAIIKRIDFIEKSTAIPETFSFAEPKNMLQAIKIYAGDAYGSTQWDVLVKKLDSYI